MDNEHIYGKNEWVGSVMQTYLNDNGDYYLRTGTASTYGLKENAKTLISAAKYYLGGTDGDGHNAEFGTADAMYLWERGTKNCSYESYCLYYSSSNVCEINFCKNDPRSALCNTTRNTNWVGEVALMYPSDHYLVYANGVDSNSYSESHRCENGGTNFNCNLSLGWIYNSNNLEGQNNPYHNWFLSPVSDDSHNVFAVVGSGTLYYYYAANTNYGTRPVLYLSSNVKITDGTGEQNNPYKLGL